VAAVAARESRAGVTQTKGIDSMVVTCVHVVVASGHVEDFIRATRINHEASIKEPQNLRFDVLQDPDDPSRFVLYEAYESGAGAAAHKQTPHYATWRETVEPWMAEPRKGIPYTVIAP
jgi:(4S)-4-hydroxy-5-phosphonooxypentane-2,3-dione isomerase